MANLRTYQEWTKEEKIAAACCIIWYPTESEYVESCGYNDGAFGDKTAEEILTEGKQAFLYAKGIYEGLSLNYTDNQILEMLDY